MENKVIYDSAIPTDAKVESIISEGNWRWPVTASIDLREIQAAIPNSLKPRPNMPEKVVWLPSSNGNFSTASAWNELRLKNSRVPWFELV